MKLELPPEVGQIIKRAPMTQKVYKVTKPNSKESIVVIFDFPNVLKSGMGENFESKKHQLMGHWSRHLS